jgi:hypothetical protein
LRYKRNNKKSVYCHDVGPRFKGAAEESGIHEYAYNETFLIVYLLYVVEKKEKKRSKKGFRYCTPTKFQNHQLFQQILIILELKRENNRVFLLLYKRIIS